jgi:hypothetical protein
MATVQPTDSEQIKVKTQELFELKEQLKAINKDTKVLRDRVKELTSEIGTFMSNQAVETVKVNGVGKISQKLVEKKGTFTKQTVRNGLEIFFNGDAAMIEGAMNAIEDNLPKKTTTQVSSRTLKG